MNALNNHPPRTRLKTIFRQNEELKDALTIGWLRQKLQEIPVEIPRLISLEPRAELLKRDGRRLRGRLSGLAPLAHALPDGLDDLPLLAASLFLPDRWQHFFDEHILSGTKRQCITWSFQPLNEKPITDLQCVEQEVMAWQERDRQRFGLSEQQTLPTVLKVEHFYQSGKRLAWRLIPPPLETKR